MNARVAADRLCGSRTHPSEKSSAKAFFHQSACRATLEKLIPALLEITERCERKRVQPT
jgi:hypothetical protein